MMKVKQNFPNNPALQRAKLLDNENFRLSPKEMKQIEAHQNPYKASPFKRPVDSIQKPAKKAQLIDKKFGRNMPHPHALHTIGHH